MFNSPVIGDSGRVSARRSAFSQTCALLSRYVKEKKAFGDVGFDVASNIYGRDSDKVSHQTTMNLFPVSQIGEEVQTQRIANSVSPVSQQASSAAQKPTSSEIKSAPMTVFYGGQVIVINDFPAHKAKEVMELASLGVFQNLNRTTAGSENVNEIMNGESCESKSMLDLNSITSLIPQKSIPTIISDLPQKRKASLHRFMGKRKERIAARAPYAISKLGKEFAAAGAGLV